MGSVLAYSLSPYFCTAFKLYGLLVAIGVGMAGYSTVEWLESRAKKGKLDERLFELVATEGQK